VVGLPACAKTPYSDDDEHVMRAVFILLAIALLFL
jgi:hypothetical protein